MAGEPGTTETPSDNQGLIRPEGPKLTGEELKAKADRIANLGLAPAREVKPELTTPDVVAKMREELAKEQDADRAAAIRRNIRILGRQRGL